MKKILITIAAFVIATGILYSCNARAAEPFTPEQKAAAQTALKEVAKNMGVELPAQPAEKQDGAKPDEKKNTVSWPEVADKVVEKSASFVTTVAETLQKAAPEVFRVMVRQQYAVAIGQIIYPLGVMIVFIVAAAVLRRFWKKPATEDYDINEWGPAYPPGWHVLLTLVIPGVVCIIYGTEFFNNLGDSIQRLVNPEFYAIRDLLKMLLAPGSV